MDLRAKSCLIKKKNLARKTRTYIVCLHGQMHASLHHIRYQ